MRINIGLLAACQALMFTANSVLIATAALVGIMLLDDPTYATVPVAIVFVFGMGCAMPASLLMKKIGRRAGFQIGSIFGIAGSILCGMAIIQHNIYIFCVGIGCLGIHNAFGNFYRFAAVDVATDDYKSRAISFVLAGSVISAFAGPNLANLTREVVGTAIFAGSYFALAVCYLVALCIISFLQVPDARESQTHEVGRRLFTIAKQPTFIISVFSATVGYGVMNLLMTSTPLAMDKNGLSFGHTAQVIQWHIAAMFAPSFVTGHLLKKFGDVAIMLTGVIAFIVSIVVATTLESTFITFCMSLIFLGIGWNFTFLGGTTLLTTSYRQSEKAKAQGFNDLCVFSVVSITALSSGILHHTLGWQVLCIGALIPVIVLGVAIIWYRIRSIPKIRGVTQ